MFSPIYINLGAWGGVEMILVSLYIHEYACQIARTYSQESEPFRIGGNFESCSAAFESASLLHSLPDAAVAMFSLDLPL